MVAYIVSHHTIINTSGNYRTRLSLMETRKSLGVEEKSSKLAISNCFTWTGSQSSMMNLRENREEKNKPIRILIQNISYVERIWTYQILLLQGLSMYMSMFSIKMAEVLCRDSVKYESMSHRPANSSAAWIIFCNVRYLCFWVRTENFSSTLHRSIVVEALLDLLSCVWITAVGRMNRLSWRGGK